jgi:hypothetical protein
MWTSAESRQSRRRRRPPEVMRKCAHEDHIIRPQLRLKCIVQGSAGAGKTSLLRRFVHGTFEGPDGRDNHYWRRRTRGADYYVKRVGNPLFDGGAAAASPSSPGRDGGDDGGGGSCALAAESRHLLVQLWDTVGKESLKPQRRPAQYDARSNFYQFLSIRPSPASTNNSNYEHRYNNWGFLNGIAREHGGGGANGRGGKSGPVRDVGDEGTDEARPGHGAPQHRGPAKLSRHDNTNEPTGDALFRNIDACMLVYDAT